MTISESPLEEATVLLRNTSTRIVVVGASNYRWKYGNIIFRDLTARGYDVLPVNPGQATVEGVRAFKTLAEVPKPVDIVDVVTPPAVTRRILEDAAIAGISLVWLQDGSFDDEVLAVALAQPFRTVHHACIMVVARRVHAVPPP